MVLYESDVVEVHEIREKPPGRRLSCDSTRRANAVLAMLVAVGVQKSSFVRGRGHIFLHYF